MCRLSLAAVSEVYSLAEMCRLLTAVVSLEMTQPQTQVLELQELWLTGLVVPEGLVWDLPVPGIEPVSPALAGEFLTTGPPGDVLKGLI